MSIVYVTNADPMLDYSGLSRYGQVTYVTRGSADPKNRVGLVSLIIDQLVRSKPTDYLALTGNPFETLISIVVWLRLHGTVQALVLWQNEWHHVPFLMSDLALLIEKVKDLIGRERV